jgi:hypothetical protein
VGNERWVPCHTWLALWENLTIQVRRVSFFLYVIPFSYYGPPFLHEIAHTLTSGPKHLTISIMPFKKHDRQYDVVVFGATG